MIQKHPKILCGYSDITALLNAIYAKTGLVTYHGPHFSTFGFTPEEMYTRNCFLDCVMKEESIRLQPSDTAGNYVAIQSGEAEGVRYRL